MSVEPALPVAPGDFLAKLLPVSPTTQRSFARSDKVTAFVRAYARDKNAPRSAVLTTVILDENNHEAHRSAGAISQLTDDYFVPPAARAARTRRLSPAVRVTSGRTSVRREARFYVREK